MRDLTSTKREFTALGQRLYRRRPLSALSVNRPFTGVIGSGFGTWIRDHWGLSNPGLFRPVDREFQTPTKPFALLNWAQPKRAGETNYNFSTTLRLTCFPQQINNSLFDVDATGIFQTLALKQPAGAPAEFVRNVLVEGTDRRTRDYHFLERIFHIFNRESSTHRLNTARQNTKLKEFLSSLFSTFSQTVGEVTRHRDSERSFWIQRQRSTIEKSLPNEIQRLEVEKSLRSEVRRFAGSTSFRRDFALMRSHSATAEARNYFLTLRPLILSGHSTGEMADPKTVATGPLSNLSTSRHWQRTTDLHTRLDRQFLTMRSLAAKNARAEGNSHFETNVFTTLALNFAAPKLSEMELAARRISQFVSSPELTHIKRQQAISEEVMNALRAQRTPYVEPKPVPMPVMPSIQQLTDQVRTQLERDLRIERERRGL